MGRWLGVDVGGPRKQFDAALVEDDRVVALEPRRSVDHIVALVESSCPSVVAIDSPRSCAPPGQTRRESKRELAAEVCNIRWTPPRDDLDGNDYYRWIVEGLRLYDALRDAPCDVIECFPTASWTRWHGARRSRTRARWTREALSTLGVEGVPRRTNQDQRDAIAAALTARAYYRGQCTSFGGEIVVPRRPER